jgi:L-serine deaminase
MSISITVGKARIATITMKNDDGSTNTASNPTVSAPSSTVRATLSPSNNREVAVVGVSLNSSGANVSIGGLNGSHADQVFTVAAPTGLASTSLGGWSDEVDPPAWA